TLALDAGGSVQDLPIWDSLEDLAGARLRVDYTQPGWYEWRMPGLASFYHAMPFAVPVEQDQRLHFLSVPHVCERTREAAVAAVSRIEPRIRQALLLYVHSVNPQFEETQAGPLASQIRPTRLGLAVAYVGGTSSRRSGAVPTALVKSNEWTYT